MKKIFLQILFIKIVYLIQIKKKKINEYENKKLPNIKIINTDHIIENDNTYLN